MRKQGERNKPLPFFVHHKSKLPERIKESLQKASIHKYLLFSTAAALGLFGRIMMQFDHYSIAVASFLLAGLFGGWKALVICTAGKDTTIVILSIYAGLSLIAHQPLVWWFAYPDISKTLILESRISVNNTIIPFPSKSFVEYNNKQLLGDIMIRHIFPPRIPLPYIPNVLYKFSMIISHTQPGKTVTGQIRIYPTKGLEVVFDESSGIMAWPPETNAEYYMCDFESVRHYSEEKKEPHYVCTYAVRPKDRWPRKYTIKYDIHDATVTDSKENETRTGVVNGRFRLIMTRWQIP